LLLVTQAGHDPVEMLSSTGSRGRMLHIKDRKPGLPPSQKWISAEHFTEVGDRHHRLAGGARRRAEGPVWSIFREQDSAERRRWNRLPSVIANLRSLL